jgi:hypothetical protein
MGVENMTTDEQIERLSQDNSELKVLLHNCREEKKKVNQQLLLQEQENENIRKELEDIKNGPPLKILLTSTKKTKQEITQQYVHSGTYKNATDKIALLQYNIREQVKEILGLKAQIKILSNDTNKEG